MKSHGLLGNLDDWEWTSQQFDEWYLWTAANQSREQKWAIYTCTMVNLENASEEVLVVHGFPEHDGFAHFCDIEGDMDDLGSLCLCGATVEYEENGAMIMHNDMARGSVWEVINGCKEKEHQR